MRIIAFSQLLRVKATKCKKCQSLRLLHIAEWNTPSLQAHHLTFRSEKALLVQMQSSTRQAQILVSSSFGVSFLFSIIYKYIFGCLICFFLPVLYPASIYSLSESNSGIYTIWCHVGMAIIGAESRRAVQSVPCYPDCSQQAVHYRESDEGVSPQLCSTYLCI